jgi:hypothetical protein
MHGSCLSCLLRVAPAAHTRIGGQPYNKNQYTIRSFILDFQTKMFAILTSVVCATRPSHLILSFLTNRSNTTFLNLCFEPQPYVAGPIRP